MIRWFIAVLLLAISITSFADTVITELTSEITVQKDTSIIVKERFIVDSDGTQIHHGIFRDIPVKYKTTSGLTKRIGLEVIGTTLNDKPTPFTQENHGNQIRVKIGDPHVDLPAGRYTFQIIYQATQELGFFKDHDELYWNVTGNNWLFPIISASATVILPPDAIISETKAFTGLFGATEQQYHSAHTEWAAMFTSSAPLYPGEGLTIVVGWQKGVLPEPTFVDNVFNSITYYQSVFSMLLGLVVIALYYCIVWLNVKKIRPTKHTIFPHFKPPQGFDASDLRYILIKKFDDRVFVAAILSLASKGYFTIKQSDNEYTLIRKDATQDLSYAEQGLLQDLFFNTDGILPIDKDNAERFLAAKNAYKSKLTAQLSKGYFVRSITVYLIGAALALLTFFASNPENPLIVIFGITTLGFPILQREYKGTGLFVPSRSWLLLVILAVIFVPFLLPFSHLKAVDSADIVYFTIAFIIVAINIGGFYTLNYYTKKGQAIVEQINGFIMFLNATEKQRLEMATAPELTSDLFERFLPYAVAFDVEINWSNQFASLFSQTNYQPTWYVGSNYRNVLYSNLYTTNLSAAMGAAIATVSSSIPGSSSGFGGGGSSGGGGGGGGGGGW